MPPGCTDERERAGGFGDITLLQEWDGTPFRVDLFDHFPAVAGADYPEDQLEVVRGFADQIEERLGYRIIEAGSVIPVPENMPEGWNDPSFEVIFATCSQWREPGQILGIHLSRLPDGHRGGGSLDAVSRCASVRYWVRDGLLPTERERRFARTAILHEMSHLFGFKHPDDTHWPESVGIFTSPQLTFGDDDGNIAYTDDDIDVLRCLFPDIG